MMVLFVDNLITRNLTFFASFDSLIITKIRSDTYLCRSSHFGVNDDNNNNNNDDRRTKRLLYPLLRMRARGKNFMRRRSTHLHAQ